MELIIGNCSRLQIIYTIFLLDILHNKQYCTYNMRHIKKVTNNIERGTKMNLVMNLRVNVQKTSLKQDFIFQVFSIQH